jgi:hypothetical protein
MITKIEELNYILRDTTLKVNRIKKLENNANVCIVSCSIHGDANKWCNPWNPSIRVVKRGYGCLKCNNCYTGTEDEMFSDINTLLADKNYKLKSFENYTNNRSICNMVCNIHGNGNEWDTPWLPRLNHIKAGTGCPKCNNCYKPSEKEVLADLKNNFLSNKNYNIISIDNYENHKSKCNMVCDIHGDGNKWDKPWNPRINDLKNGKGCPKCSNEKNTLLKTLNNSKQFEQERYLYFVEFIKDDKSYFKIGLCSHENINIRYSPTVLENNNIKINLIEIIKLPNLIALSTEYYILKSFDKNKKYFNALRTSGLNGATECFDTNFLAKRKLKFFINKTISEFTNIIKDEYFKLSSKSIKKIEKQFNLLSIKS